MNIILTGATGILGAEVLRRALDDAAIEHVLALTRRASGLVHAKLNEVVRPDFLDYSGLDLRAYDACIWCGCESHQTTNDHAMAAAAAMFVANSGLRFCFVTGRSADPTGKRGTLLARMKGFGEIIRIFNADPSVTCAQLARCLVDIAKHGTNEQLLARHAVHIWKSTVAA